ncbi:MAG: cadmium-translocating P-type ATPase [Treponema sp.]|jgi:Cd2+/Zn2+-exporting ATPase|nr:cadmium-translocating P-type ATPase [Treponema sp.]
MEKQLTRETACCPHCAAAIAPGESASGGQPGNSAGTLKTAWEKWLNTVCLSLGAALFALGMAFELIPSIELAPAVRLTVFFVSWLLIGGEVALQAVLNIFRGRLFDENFLMGLATVGAFAIGEYPEGAAVMLFYRIGEAFQDMAVKRSRRSISALMDIRPDFASLKRGGEVVRVNPGEVQPGDSIVVKPGEKIPLDGIVASGRSALDTSALTGEALPRDVETGDTVLSGSINKNGLLVITVTKAFGDSTVSKILELVQNAGNRKAPVENFITRFARYYTPAVVFAAAALAVLPPLITVIQQPQVQAGTVFAEWIRRALVFLVVSCPCALVISIPLGFFGGIGGASRRGILIKGSNYLSALNDVTTVVFDKTGTLTKGIFTVSDIHCGQNITRDELLYYAAAAESNSNHPIALSIVRACGRKIDSKKISAYEEIPGKGIRAVMEGKTILAGNARFLEANGITPNIPETPGTAVCVAVDGVYSGCLAIADELKPDSRRTVAELKKAGIRTVMLSGDSEPNARRIGTELGIDDVFAGLLPHQKVERLETLQNETGVKGKLAFAGDGINDAPALARSDIGIAMGALGSDAAIEAADIVLMTDEPFKLVDALKIARRTRSIVWQNIVFALGVKTLILVLGAFGIATMWEAVFGDVGVALIAVCNAMRALRPAAEK